MTTTPAIPGPPAPSIAEASGASTCVGQTIYVRGTCKGVIREGGKFWVVFEPIRADGSLAAPECEPRYYFPEGAMIDGATMKAIKEAAQ